MKKSIFGEIFTVIKYPLLFLVICWSIYFCDYFFHLNVFQYGISPRRWEGLIGIIFAPFIHENLAHISNNSLPIFILGCMIFYFYKPIAWSVILWMLVISDVWLWIGGRNNDIGLFYHFGASILIYSFATFLFFSGVFRKHKQLMVVSAIVVFLYGSITYGIFPFDEKVSWEGHLSGAIAGLLVAFNYRKEGPQAPQYNWPEEEEDLEAIYNEQQRQLKYFELQDQDTNEPTDAPKSPPSLDPFNILYHYKKKEDEDKK